MLELINIRKTYGKDESAVEALKGVSIKFRESEFVSILGQSGCGKTTLLNIIGGLDQYTSGDLIINGVSTKAYKDSDWDTYRNHTIGFIFQSYNLISHQSVLANVELALTLSGISKQERRRKAVQALDKVGLRSHMHKRPNQLSGGQMQRVAIARALINNPDILLADEPTGALDSETSVQVMDLLKEIAKDRLVVMVTHNPELAEMYSTRIIRLSDGNLIGDSNPFDGRIVYNEAGCVDTPRRKEPIRRKKKSSMSFITAMSLSFNNLMTKKGRTFLTSFAGSIGIIGIALILSVSTGVQAYIDSIEQSTMSSYPIQIQQSTMNPSSMMSALMQSSSSNEPRDPNKIYSSEIMVQMMTSMSSSISINNLEKFKDYIESHPDFKNYCTDVKYSYSAKLNTYFLQEDGTYKNSSKGMDQMYDTMGLTGISKEMMSSMASMMSSMGSVTGWTELIGDTESIMNDYELVDGRYPESLNEIVLIVDKNNQISDYTLYVLGIRDYAEVQEWMKHAIEAYINGTENTYEIEPTNYTFDEIYDFQFKVLLDSDHYVLQDGKIHELDTSVEEDNAILNERLDNAMELKIVGILRPSDDSMAMANIGTIGYMSDLMDNVIARSNKSDVVKAQLADKEVDLFTGIRFDSKGYTIDDIPYLSEILEKYPSDVASAIINQVLNYLNKDRVTTNTYDGNLKKLGYIDVDNPSSISIYPKDFEAKEQIVKYISEYNEKQSKDDRITYTDTVALLMSSVTTIIDAISYVLIAFVAISLVVSSIMIGIITYISVLERTKEIGILRAIGASKRDIARVFNAETIFVGFVAGLIGIVCSLGLIVVINMILFHFTGLANLKAVLEPIPAIILVGISVVLTFVAGLFPSKTASKKDPVIALRTE
ncbi:MAG: ATP-binding cassette domain-containing protein [Eubacteriales bacterium]